MRGMVIFVLVLVGLASFSFAAANISNEIIKPKKSYEMLQFSTFTSAVCENKGEVFHCKDEFFVNCNGNISKAVDVAECEGIQIDAPKTLGFAVFSKDWKDPRV